MPGSSKFGKLYTALMIKKLADSELINSILDIGVGMGTYYNLISPHVPNADWTGVEVWEPYIEQFQLKDKYPTLINQDIRKLDFDKEPKRDLSMLGDILEHMEKEEAQVIIEKLLDKSRAILISIPIVHYPQGEEFGNPYEAHVKDDWSHEEVMQSFPNILSAFIHDHIGVYFLSNDAQMATAIKTIQPTICGIIRKQLPDDNMVWG